MGWGDFVVPPINSNGMGLCALLLLDQLEKQRVFARGQHREQLSDSLEGRP
jgi:hypothetical protein